MGLVAKEIVKYTRYKDVNNSNICPPKISDLGFFLRNKFHALDNLFYDLLPNPSKL
jgi:hypothetical protein